MFYSRVSHEIREIKIGAKGLFGLLRKPENNNLRRFWRIEGLVQKSKSIKAALVIQSWYRMVKAFWVVRNLKKRKDENLKSLKAVKIQTWFKAWRGRRIFELTKIMKRVEVIREKAALIIQKTFKQHLASQKKNIFNAAKKLLEVRKTAAVSIQKCFRGFSARKDLCFVGKNMAQVLFWIGEEDWVSVIGSFTYPPWKVQIPLVYSRYLKGFYSTFFIENKMKPGNYYLKFVVNYENIVNKDMPVYVDPSGNAFNVFKVPFSLEKTCFPENSGINQTENLGTSQRSVFRSKFCNYDNSNFYFRLSFGSFMAAKPRHKRLACNTKISLDSLFYSKYHQAFVVIDGEENWESFGQDPSLFVKELISRIKDEMVSVSFSALQNEIYLDGLLEKLLTSAFNKTSSAGSSAVLLAAVIGNTLYTLNLGSTQLLILRKQEISNKYYIPFRSRSVEDYSIYFKQLTKLPEAQSKQLKTDIIKQHFSKKKIFFSDPVDSITAKFKILPGDLIVAGTKGLFNNLFEKDIIETTEKIKKKTLSPGLFCSELAKTLALESLKLSWNLDYKSPFYKFSKRAGKKALGGHLDDTSVLVSFVN